MLILTGCHGKMINTMGKELYLLPVNIAVNESSPDIRWVSPGLLERIRIIFAENFRSARRFFRYSGYNGSLDIQHWIDIGNGISTEEMLNILQMISDDAPAAIISEAGIPGIADPGADVVALCHELGIRVIPLPGPSSVFLALAASGLNGQAFTFHGYLPIHDRDRERQLRIIESAALQSNYTQIFMETPYRNLQLYKSILKVCRDDTSLCIAADITGPDELIRTQTIQSWRKSSLNINKIPAIFLLNR